MPTLSEKSYVSQILNRHFPDWSDYETGGKNGEIVESMTDKQRGLIVALSFQKDYEKIKEVCESILAFQTKRIL